jgi:hypothetical protein
MQMKFSVNAIIVFLVMFAMSTGVNAGLFQHHNKKTEPTEIRYPGERYRLNIANEKVQAFISETMSEHYIDKSHYLGTILICEYERELYMENKPLNKQMRNQVLDEMLANCRAWRDGPKEPISQFGVVYWPQAKLFFNLIIHK